MKPFSVIEWDRVFPSKWAIDGEGIGMLMFDDEAHAKEQAAYMNIAFNLGRTSALKDVSVRAANPESEERRAEGAR